MNLQAKLQEIIAMAEAATPEVWSVGEHCPSDVYAGMERVAACAESGDFKQDDLNAAFIAASRSLLPALARALEVAAERLREIADHEVNIVNVHSHSREALAEIANILLPEEKV